MQINNSATSVQLSKKSNWIELALPRFKARYIGQNGVVGRGNGHLVVDSWLPGNLMKIDYYEGVESDPQKILPIDGDVAEHDWVYLRLSRLETGPKLELVRVEARKEAAFEL